MEHEFPGKQDWQALFIQPKRLVWIQQLQQVFFPFNFARGVFRLSGSSISEIQQFPEFTETFLGNLCTICLRFQVFEKFWFHVKCPMSPCRYHNNVKWSKRRFLFLSQRDHDLFSVWMRKKKWTHERISYVLVNLTVKKNCKLILKSNSSFRFSWINLYFRNESRLQAWISFIVEPLCGHYRSMMKKIAARYRRCLILDQPCPSRRVFVSK